MRALITSIITLILCPLSYGEITSKDIQGYWRFEHGDDQFQISTITSYLSNGIFTDEGFVTIQIGDNKKKIPHGIIGRWKVEKGVLIITVEESSPPTFQKGAKIRSKLLKVTDRIMVFESDLDHKEYTATRTAKPKPEGTAPVSLPSTKLKPVEQNAEPHRVSE